MKMVKQLLYSSVRNSVRHIICPDHGVLIMESCVKMVKQLFYSSVRNSVRHIICPDHGVVCENGQAVVLQLRAE